jgi:urease accessory protein
MNLRLLQLGDSALPIGGYSHSWGLEAAIEQGVVRDAAGLERWTRSWLRYGVGPCEGVVVAASCRAASKQDYSTVARASDLLEISIVPPTLRHAGREMGEQLLALAAPWEWAMDAVAALRREPLASGAWHHAPVFATLAATAGAEPADALLVFLHQVALGCISAGVRAVPVGHTHGQQILARLHDDVAELARTLATADLEVAGSFSPTHELFCHAQAGLYTRLFRS